MPTRRLLFLLPLPLLLWAADPHGPREPVAPADVGLSAERLGRITRTIEGDVAAGRIAGAVGLLARRGEVAYFEARGQADRERSIPMAADTIFRIYSMSKPITSAALMMLHEEGKFRLTDPVGRYLPEFDQLEVLENHPDFPGQTRRVPAKRKITIQDLLRHTAGLTYGFFGNTEVDRLYREADVFDYSGDLADMTAKLGKLPLLFHPGEKWHYSVAVDVQGRLIEVLSGQRFDRFLKQRIFEPLGMADTGFHVPAEKHGRFAQLYAPTEKSKEKLKLGARNARERFKKPATLFSGGGGMVSTAEDYLRFCSMMLNGGELGGVRLLGRKTVELMTRDHLRGAPHTRTLTTGYGFGLGVAVHVDPAASGDSASVGEYRWGGAAGTRFWIDPEEEMIGIYMVQILPHAGLRYGTMFKQLAYQAIVD